MCSPTLTQKCDAVLYKTMHFDDTFVIFYHSHICEKNNMTVMWLLHTVSLPACRSNLFTQL